MKNFLILIAFVISFSALALDRSGADRLLQQRQLSLQQMERSGARLLLGEVTGAGFVLPADRVQVVFVRGEAILRKEIESMDFSPATGSLKDLSSFRVRGMYFTKEDIRGAVVK